MGFFDFMTEDIAIDLDQDDDGGQGSGFEQWYKVSRNAEVVEGSVSKKAEMYSDEDQIRDKSAVEAEIEVRKGVQDF